MAICDAALGGFSAQTAGPLNQTPRVAPASSLRRQRLTALVQFHPVLELGHMLGFLLEKLLGQHLDLGISGVFQHVGIEAQAGRLGVQRHLQRLLDADEGGGGPDRGGFGAFDVGPAKAGVRLGVAQVQQRIIGQLAHI